MSPFGKRQPKIDKHLAANEVAEIDPDASFISKQDQLIKILSALGHQDENDTSFIMDKNSLKYVQRVNHGNRLKKSLRQAFPYSSADLIELLEQML